MRSGAEPVYCEDRANLRLFPGAIENACFEPYSGWFVHSWERR